MSDKILARCTGFNVYTDGRRVTSLPPGHPFRWGPINSTTLRRFKRCWVALGYFLGHEIEGRFRLHFHRDAFGTYFYGGPFTVDRFDSDLLAGPPISIGCRRFTIKQADRLWRNLAPFYDYEVED